MADVVEVAAPRGLFVGLCVLDVIQSVERLPGPDEKATALRQTVAAGGPATNAAATFAALGGAAALVTGVGRHRLADAIRDDLAGIGVPPGGVRLLDADSGRTEPPSVSSVLVTASTGDRAVVSANAIGRNLAPPPGLAAEVAAADVLLVDGHHMAVAQAAAAQARDRRRPVVLDGGSWKTGTDTLLESVDVAVCSAAFRPPGTTAPDDVLAYLLDHGVAFAAVSRGPRPIRWRSRGGGTSRVGEVPAPVVDRVVDSVGAGDVLHGALAYAIATRRKEHPWGEREFVEALNSAATTASRSCATFGTRAWMSP
ncbi:PfkB family carbohydrate kinase [Yinghuangia sp. ASG 101]|uniref:PfkB family carbohydrate kinase n=1 Tax=Yinghuangia sp. ASG 101 TaxID=2896848 RepID=UPI001E5A51BF|nr:PfkB family carbohydrate kinase [Yinghuangia sp. ASG 101]UGQ11688.1 PfkB family carbohydrate kinase [Yinghuangia sp. ASG 101]